MKDTNFIEYFAGKILQCFLVEIININKNTIFVPMKEDNQIQQVESKIIVIRDTQVILDRHVAERYGVETKKINRFSCFFLRILFGSFR
ncbi:hypothetical protein IX307_002684 [Bacteroides pyogenes]|uniref:ORF6N domain-containing protein n=2 Tax=Bacteroides pyogenes TaxID=310300 RepID=UPI001EC588E0|nr:hypothetical protein [Bacteroides pyogenes]MBR8721466.1 hypothetical protein [Bacteroides pyogenes]MBR8725585.1 hypothetical protein [Bacteroides pyogenes]MBR8738832.1 hypothetical protein [Bacteroides pyogenes]MBR8754625.1 hypothetical protein [Bacteroides pyogenes]